MVGLEPRALCLLGRHSTPSASPAPDIFSFLLAVGVSCCVRYFGTVLNTQEKQLRGQTLFILAHGFRDLSPLFLALLILGPWEAEH